MRRVVYRVSGFVSLASMFAGAAAIVWLIVCWIWGFDPRLAGTCAALSGGAFVISYLALGASDE